MSAKPVVVKLIECLIPGEGVRSPAQIAEAIGEPVDAVRAALERLAEMKVVAPSENGYVYRPAPENDNLLAKLTQVFHDVAEGRAATELLIRSYVCQIPSRHLFHLTTLVRLLEREGIDHDVAAPFLDQEVDRGYLRRTTTIYTRQASPQLFPVCMTPYHFERLRRLGAVEHARAPEPDGVTGGCIEDYLVARYPAKLARQARERAAAEGRELTAVLRRMGIMGRNGWWWRNRIASEDE
jgi:hypothetical protein